MDVEEPNFSLGDAWNALIASGLRTEENRAASALRIYLGTREVRDGHILYSAVFKPVEDEARVVGVTWKISPDGKQDYIIFDPDQRSEKGVFFDRALAVLNHMGIWTGDHYVAALEKMHMGNVRGRNIKPLFLDYIL